MTDLWLRLGAIVAHLGVWSRRFLKLGVYTVLMLTVLTLTGHFLLPMLERYQSTIEQRLSLAMKTPVRIAQFKAHWVGIEPDIVIDGLKIYHPKQANTVLLEIPHIHIELALWQSLKNWDWRLDAQAQGIHVHLTEQATGEWVIEELLALGKDNRPEVRKTAVNWLLKQAELQFSDLQVDVHPYQHAVLQLTKMQLTNRNRGSRHDFRLMATLNQQPVKLFADLVAHDDLLNPFSWQGQVYAKLSPQALQSWISPEQLPSGLTISSLTVGGEFWLGLQHGQIQKVVAALNVPQAVCTYDQQLFQAQQLTGLVSWQQEPQQAWQATIQHLTGSINQHPVPLATFAIQKKSQTMDVAAQQITVEALSALLQEVPRPDLKVLKQWLLAARPTGKITRLGMQISQDNHVFALKKISAEFEQLSALATTEYAGGKNISGWFNHNEHGGQASIQIDDGELDLRQIYRVPTALEQLNASFVWRHVGNEWRIDSNNITLKNNDTHGHAVLSVHVPDNDIGAAKMKLLASIYDGKLTSVWRYVPWPSAGDDTIAWLKSALISGDIVRGDFLYDGVLIDKPEHPPSTMQMNFDVKNGVLAYAPEWPLLKQLNANINLYNRSLTITAKNSQIYESIAPEIVAKIPELNSPQLHINAVLNSTGEDVLRIFKETPLKSEAGRVADLLAIKGEVLGLLQLDIPLANDNPINVNVTVELLGNPVILRQASEFDLWLSGVVNYQTGEGLTSQPLQGFFLGQPVSVKLHSVMGNGDVAAVQIQANGQFTPPNLKPWLGDLTRSMSGKALYQAALTVPVFDEPVHIAFDSDLAGWTIDLPEPLGKKTEPLALHYEMQLEAGHEQTAYFVLGSRLQSAFGIRDGKITRAIVQLGDNWSGELPKQGLWVNGRLSSLSIDDWLPWLRPLASNIPSKNVSAALPELQSFSVDVDKMSYMGYVLHDVRLGLEPEDNQAWRLQIISDDLSGEALFAHSPQQPMKINLQTLNLPFDVDKSYQSRPTKTADDWAIPKMNIHIDDLSLKAWPKFAHSQVKAQLMPTTKGVRLSQIAVTNPAFSIEGALDWQWHGIESTTYSGQINIPNIANAFSAFNATPVLNSQQATAQLSLQWLGDPTDLGLASLTGQLLIDLKKGRVLNLNRMVSLSRLLGVLDSDNIKRRLKFDFSDITQKGLAYDTIHFESEIEKGLMQNQIIFHSPSLHAQGQGKVNLVTTDLEQFFEISVPMSSAVPYAAAVVAGPVVGGALVAAEAMFDNSLTKMTTLHYKVSGQWQKPTVERMKNPMFPWRSWFKPKQKKAP